MTCQHARIFLDAWLDDELDVSSALNLEQHVADCPDCRLLGRRKCVAGKTLGVRIEAAQNKPSGPDDAPAVFKQRLHEVITQGVRIFGVTVIRRDPVAVVAVQSALRAKPHEATTVLQDRKHRIVG